MFFFTMQDGRIAIMWAGSRGNRELVEILFPLTKPIPSIPDWSIDGILRATKYLHWEVQVCN
jgi:2-keto-4-pentenoate hydratase